MHAWQRQRQWVDFLPSIGLTSLSQVTPKFLPGGSCHRCMVLVVVVYYSLYRAVVAVALPKSKRVARLSRRSDVLNALRLS